MSTFCSICCICCAPGMTNFCLMKSGSGSCCGKDRDDEEYEDETAQMDQLRESRRLEREQEAEAAKADKDKGADKGRRSSVDKQPGPRASMRAEIRQDD